MNEVVCVSSEIIEKQSNNLIESFDGMVFNLSSNWIIDSGWDHISRTARTSTSLSSEAITDKWTDKIFFG